MEPQKQERVKFNGGTATSEIDHVSAKYPLKNLFDDSLASAWCTGAARPVIEIELRPEDSVEWIALGNGYQKSLKSFHDNALATAVDIQLFDFRGSTVYKISQKLNIPSSLPATETIRLTKTNIPAPKLTLTFTRNQGIKSNDFCLSDLKLKHTRRSVRPLTSSGNKDSDKNEKQLLLSKLTPSSLTADRESIGTLIQLITKNEDTELLQRFFSWNDKVDGEMATEYTWLLTR